MGINMSMQVYQKNDQIAWTKPPKDCYKLNVHRIDKKNIAAVGGVLRNEIEKIDIAYARPAGDVTVLVAEY